MVPLVAALLIDLSEQRLVAFDTAGRAVYRAAVSSGRAATPTPTGRFAIGVKYSVTPMVGPDYRIPAVPHVMCLIGGDLRPDAVCIHAAPWQERGGERFGVPRSHGCIRTGAATARWLFQHTPVGTPVTIRD